MIHIALPDEAPRRLVYYLAMEEYVADHLKELVPPSETGEREALFLWQVPPTVIFGRNQVMEAEVNLTYCLEHGVQLYRRKSGGGCVYADMGNVMVSYVCDRTDVTFTFDRYLRRMAHALERLGLKAEVSGRNDILVNGKKVSGNAFFMRPQAGIVHGTLLFDSDFEALERAITPSEAKIHSKGVASVRQHVTNLRDELQDSMTIGEFKEYLLESFCDRELCLTESQMEDIAGIEAGYLDPDFLAGRKHSYTLERKAKIEGVGEVGIELDMDCDRIERCHLSGDFFPVRGDVDEALTECLKGCTNDIEAAEKALSGLVMEDYVLNLTNRKFLEYAFGNNTKNFDNQDGRES